MMHVLDKMRSITLAPLFFNNLESNFDKNSHVAIRLKFDYQFIIVTGNCDKTIIIFKMTR